MTVEFAQIFFNNLNVVPQGTNEDSSECCSSRALESEISADSTPDAPLSDGSYPDGLGSGRVVPEPQGLGPGEVRPEPQELGLDLQEEFGLHQDDWIGLDAGRLQSALVDDEFAFCDCSNDAYPVKSDVLLCAFPPGPDLDGLAVHLDDAFAGDRQSENGKERRSLLGDGEDFVDLERLGIDTDLPFSLYLSEDEEEEEEKDIVGQAAEEAVVVQEDTGTSSDETDIYHQCKRQQRQSAIKAREKLMSSKAKVCSGKQKQSSDPNLDRSARKNAEENQTARTPRRRRLDRKQNFEHFRRLSTAMPRFKVPAILMHPMDLKKALFSV